MEESSSQQSGYVSCDEWKKSWSVGYIPFHLQQVHSYLEKHISQMTNGRQNLKIFFPLSGKDEGMKWLADQGHTVVGVEASPVAAKEFFTEHNMEYTEEAVEHFQVFKSKDSKVIFYCGDMFLFSRAYEGKFDGIWDRGSLVAIGKFQREKYVHLMEQLMDANARYLLVTFEYDQSKMDGPPSSIPGDIVQELFGSRCTVELLEEKEFADEEFKKLDYMKEAIYLLKLKQTEAPAHPQADRIVTGDKWIGDWDRNHAPFHKTEVNSILQRHLTELTKGRTELKMFIPLCGKSVDMKWLADLGHIVVGVEISSTAIKDFFQEQQLEYTEEEIDNFTVYRSTDNKIHLYCGDLYHFNSGHHGQFDGIWDRGSLVAISPRDREKYVRLMEELISPQGRCLLSSLDYDPTKMAGPPFSIPPATVKKLYEENFTVKVLDQTDIIIQKWKDRGLETMIEGTFIIIPKTP